MEGNRKATRVLSYEAETTKKSIRTKAEIVSVSVLSKVLSLNKLSCPQIWNIEKEKVGDRPAKLNKKKSDRAKAEMKKKQRRHFFYWKNHEKWG